MTVKMLVLRTDGKFHLFWQKCILGANRIQINEPICYVEGRFLEDLKKVGKIAIVIHQHQWITTGIYN